MTASVEGCSALLVWLGRASGSVYVLDYFPASATTRLSAFCMPVRRDEKENCKLCFFYLNGVDPTKVRGPSSSQRLKYRA